MKSRKYDSEDAAFTYLESIGDLKFWGREGRNYEYCVCTLTLPDGRKYRLDIYRDGNVIVRE